jgi:hypothetical protein
LVQVHQKFSFFFGTKYDNLTIFSNSSFSRLDVQVQIQKKGKWVPKYVKNKKQWGHRVLLQYREALKTGKHTNQDLFGFRSCEKLSSYSPILLTEDKCDFKWECRILPTAAIVSDKLTLQQPIVLKCLTSTVNSLLIEHQDYDYVNTGGQRLI